MSPDSALPTAEKCLPKLFWKTSRDGGVAAPLHKGSRVGKFLSDPSLGLWVSKRGNQKTCS